MKTKVYIVTGFLGAGKTTLIKQVLKFSHDLSGIIVVVNEFGKAGIDSSLIKKTAAADIVELTSGCICCTLKTDMIRTLEVLRHKYTPERIVIEATGVADPVAIAEALKDKALSPYFSVEKTITVVDGDFWEAREVFGTVFKSQIKHGDIILLNKIDTLDKPSIPVILKEIRTEAENAVIIPVLHCNIDPDIFWAEKHQEAPGITGESLFRAYDPENDFYSGVKDNVAETAEKSGFISFSFETSEKMDEKLFMEFLSSIPLELFRIKGPVKFINETRMLNFTGGKMDWQEWTETASTCLVFIGWDIVQDRILKKLNACLVKK